MTKQPISDSARTRGLFGRSGGLGNGDGWLAIHSPLNAGEGWFPPAGISMWARGRSQSIKHSGLRTDIINIVLAPPPKSLNRWSCCQFLQSQFQTVRIQQKVVNAHRQYTMFVIQRSWGMRSDNDFFERIIDLQK